jgi:hypothetical protein
MGFIDIKIEMMIIPFFDSYLLMLKVSIAGYAISTVCASAVLFSIARLIHDDGHFNF